MFKDKRTAMTGILVVAFFLSLSTLTDPGTASAAYDSFLKIDGIPGESTIYRGGIDVISWSFGEIQPGAVTHSTAGGASAGIVKMQDFKFTMRTSKASPKLFLACARGEHLRSAVLEVYKSGSGGPGGYGKTGGPNVLYLKITLAEVLVSSFLALGNSKSAEAYPMEEVTLNFSKIEIEYWEIGPDGKSSGSVKAVWDLKQNKGM